MHSGLFYRETEATVRSRGGKGNCGGRGEVLLGTWNRQHCAKTEAMGKGSGPQQRASETPGPQVRALISVSSFLCDQYLTSNRLGRSTYLSMCAVYFACRSTHQVLGWRNLPRQRGEAAGQAEERRYPGC